MKKKILVSLIVLVGLYFLGSTPQTTDYDQNPNLTIPTDFIKLEQYIAKKQAVKNLRPNNEAKIHWANPEAKIITEYAIVYLHGFSASHYEGFPVNVGIANKFGMNMYLSRLADHGIGGENPMQNFNLSDYWKSAEEALAIGQKIGKKVILMGTSAGGSLALSLAAKYPKKVHALILSSPCIAINNPAAFILNNPWGTQIAKMVYGGDFVPADPEDSQEVLQYWTKPHRVEALPVLQQFLEDKMNEATFSKITVPTFVGAYFKDEQNQDKTVSVSAIKSMYQQLNTPIKDKWYIPFPNAKHHVITSYLRANAIEEVVEEIATFLEVVLKIPLAAPNDQVCE